MIDDDELARRFAPFKTQSKVFERAKDVWRSWDAVGFRHQTRRLAEPSDPTLINRKLEKVIETIGVRDTGFVENQKTIQSVGESELRVERKAHRDRTDRKQAAHVNDIWPDHIDCRAAPGLGTFPECFQKTP